MRATIEDEHQNVMSVRTNERKVHVEINNDNDLKMGVLVLDQDTAWLAGQMIIKAGQIVAREEGW